MDREVHERAKQLWRGLILHGSTATQQHAQQAGIASRPDLPAPDSGRSDETERQNLPASSMSDTSHAPREPVPQNGGGGGDANVDSSADAKVIEKLRAERKPKPAAEEEYVVLRSIAQHKLCFVFVRGSPGVFVPTTALTDTVSAFCELGTPSSTIMACSCTSKICSRTLSVLARITMPSRGTDMTSAARSSWMLGRDRGSLPSSLPVLAHVKCMPWKPAAWPNMYAQERPVARLLHNVCVHTTQTSNEA